MQGEHGGSFFVSLLKALKQEREKISFYSEFLTVSTEFSTFLRMPRFEDQLSRKIPLCKTHAQRLSIVVCSSAGEKLQVIKCLQLVYKKTYRYQYVNEIIIHI